MYSTPSIIGSCSLNFIYTLFSELVTGQNKCRSWPYPFLCICLCKCWACFLICCYHLLHITVCDNLSNITVLLSSYFFCCLYPVVVLLHFKCNVLRWAFLSVTVVLTLSSYHKYKLPTAPHSTPPDFGVEHTAIPLSSNLSAPHYPPCVTDPLR